MAALTYNDEHKYSSYKSSNGNLNFANGYLTKRESDVLKYVVLGYTAKNIAKLLNVSFRTVESYIDFLKLKLRCNSKGEVILVTIKSGLIHQLGIL